MNQCFQELLATKHFDMRATEKEQEWVYQGKLALNDLHTVSFSVSLSKGDNYSIGQIVYQNIAYIRDGDSRRTWYQLVNELNSSHGLFYHFYLDDEERLLARYRTEVSSDLDYFYHIFVQGTALLQQVVPLLEQVFGKFVVLK